MPAEYEINLAPFHMTFNEVAVGSGIAPQLPGGDAGITDEQAVAAVADQLGAPTAGVSVVARFGDYSSPYPARRLTTGEVQPLDQNRPVWLVTYYGPDFNVPAGHVPDASGSVPEIHAVNALVDARTGQVFSIFG